MEQLENLEEGRKELIAVKRTLRIWKNKVSALDQIDEMLKEEKGLLKTDKT